MRPTSREIIECIAEVLDTRVAPVLDDRWAESSLRSIKALLAHLAVRVEAEGPMLAADITDLREVLRGATGCLAAVAALAPFVAEIESALAREWRRPGEYPDLPSLTEEHLVLRDLVDRLLRALYGTDRAASSIERGGGSGATASAPAEAQGVAPGEVEGLAGLDPSTRDALLSEIHEYARRHLVREQPLFVPAFTTPLY